MQFELMCCRGNTSGVSISSRNTYHSHRQRKSPQTLLVHSSMERMDVELEDRDQMTLRPPRRTKCRADGTFEFKDVYPGRYHVKADFRFGEPEQNREWRVDVPVIRVPQQISGIDIRFGRQEEISSYLLQPTGWNASESYRAYIAICLSRLLIILYG